MHQKHAGHAEMHAEMIFILLVVLLLSQIVLVQWRKHRPYSYHLCTLVGRLSTSYLLMQTLSNEERVQLLFNLSLSYLSQKNIRNDNNNFHLAQREFI